MRNWRWVTRNPKNTSAQFVAIWLSQERPKMQAEIEIWLGRGEKVLVCAAEFKRLTGINIKPGECLKVEFTARVIE